MRYHIRTLRHCLQIFSADYFHERRLVWEVEETKAPDTKEAPKAPEGKKKDVLPPKETPDKGAKGAVDKRLNDAKDAANKVKGAVKDAEKFKPYQQRIEKATETMKNPEDKSFEEIVKALIDMFRAFRDMWRELVGGEEPSGGKRTEAGPTVGRGQRMETLRKELTGGKTVDALRKEKEEALKKSESRRSELTKSYAELQGSRAKQQVALEGLQKQLGDTEGKNEGLQKQVKDAQDALSKLDEQIKKQQEEITKEETNARQLREDVQILRDAPEEKKKQAAGINERVGLMRMNLQAASTTNENARALHEALANLRAEYDGGMGLRMRLENPDRVVKILQPTLGRGAEALGISPDGTVQNPDQLLKTLQDLTARLTAAKPPEAKAAKAPPTEAKKETKK